jgi:hypothetical protein
MPLECSIPASDEIMDAAKNDRGLAARKCNAETAPSKRRLENERMHSSIYVTLTVKKLADFEFSSYMADARKPSTER